MLWKVLFILHSKPTTTTTLLHKPLFSLEPYNILSFHKLFEATSTAAAKPTNTTNFLQISTKSHVSRKHIVTHNLPEAPKTPTPPKHHSLHTPPNNHLSKPPKHHPSTPLRTTSIPHPPNTIHPHPSEQHPSHTPPNNHLSTPLRTTSIHTPPNNIHPTPLQTTISPHPSEQHPSTSLRTTSIPHPPNTILPTTPQTQKLFFNLHITTPNSTPNSAILHQTAQTHTKSFIKPP